MTDHPDLTKTKCRLRGYPESEVQLFPQGPGSKYLQGRYRHTPEHVWRAAEWHIGGKIVFSRGLVGGPTSLDLIPAPDTVRSEGFWLAVDADGGVLSWADRRSAGLHANVGSDAYSNEPQGWIEYFPPREYEAGSIIDPREETVTAGETGPENSREEMAPRLFGGDCCTERGSPQAKEQSP